MVRIICTFQVLGRKKNGANMIIFDQRFDLLSDSGAIKAHHEKLANLPDIIVSIKGSMEMEIYGRPVKVVPY